MAQKSTQSQPPPPAPSRPAWVTVAVATLLIVVTLAAYQGVRHNDFVYYDDPDYILTNPKTQNGLTWDTVKWAFTQSHASNWHPITWLTHALDCQLYGLNASGHHVTSLAIHCVNVLLLFALLRTLTGAFWRAALVAALFAVHPLRVESVAWVAERKDVLSGFFFLLTLLGYARYARARKVPGGKGWGAYAGALVALGLGLMSKPMLVTTPFVLLLLDVWPLGRVDLLDRAKHGRTLWLLVREKLPFFALIAGSSIITFLAQRAGSSVVPLTAVPLGSRVGNALISYWEYLWRTVAPTDLSVYYVYRDISPGVAFLAGAGLVTVTVLCLVMLRRSGYLAVGWLWFLGMLVPVIGLVQVGSQRMADRYAYLPLIGIYVAVIWLVAKVLETRPRWQPAVIAGSTVVIVALAVLTARRVGDWRDTESLFSAAVRVHPENFLAHAALGGGYVEAGRPERALECFDRSLAVNPNFFPAYQGRGKAWLAMQRLPEAAEAFRQVIAIAPDNPDGNLSYGLTLLRLGDLPNAERLVRHGWQQVPNHMPAVLALATVLLEKGQTNEAWQLAATVQDKALGDPTASELLTSILERTGQAARSEEYLRRAVDISPKNPRSRQRLGEWLATQGRGPEALEQFQRAVEISPTNALARVQLATTLLGQGQVIEALAAYRAALQFDPNNIAALNNVAWLLATSPDATIRNGPEALRLAEHAVKLTNREEPFLLGTLAAAYAENGQYETAARTAREAQAKATSRGQAVLAQRNGELAEIYQKGKPHREPARN